LRCRRRIGTCAAKSGNQRNGFHFHIVHAVGMRVRRDVLHVGHRGHIEPCFGALRPEDRSATSAAQRDDDGKRAQHAACVVVRSARRHPCAPQSKTKHLLAPSANRGQRLADRVSRASDLVFYWDKTLWYGFRAAESSGLAVMGQGGSIEGCATCLSQSPRGGASNRSSAKDAGFRMREAGTNKA
jgi:hypothetical protein